MPPASTRSPGYPISVWAALALSILVVVGLRGLALGAIALKAAGTGLTRAQAFHAMASDPLMLASGQALTFTLVLGVGVALFRSGRSVRETLAVEPVRSSTFFIALAGGLAMSLSLAALSNLLALRSPIPLEEQLLQRALLSPDNVRDGVGAVLAFALVAPLSEELLFRGLLLPGLKERYGAPVAVLVTASLFGLLHLGHVAVAGPAFLAGILLGVLTLRTGSVLPAVALHMGNNALPLLLTESVARVEGFNTISETPEQLNPWIALIATAATLTAVGYITATATQRADS